VCAHPSGSPFHLCAWHDLLTKIFGYQPEYLIAYEGSDIVGVLPLFLVENFMTGRVLISTPFAVYGGILARGDVAHATLATAAKMLARKRAVQYLELRNSAADQRVGFSGIARYATFTRDVAPTDREGLLKSLPTKTRNLVRKALKHNYASRPAENLDAFYGLLLKTYRRHGTPVFPLKFFALLVEKFGAGIDVREVLLDGQVAAVSMNFLFRDQMHTYYAASAQELWDKSPNNFMYFDHLLWAGNNGYRIFDFGRSKIGTGPYEFKKHFGATERPLPYEIMLVKRATLPNFSPANPKFAMAIKVWQKMPLPVTRLIGPRFVGLFP
jgi:FemAB-related protein (PEP-CTERM system-associated)